MYHRVAYRRVQEKCLDLPPYLMRDLFLAITNHTELAAFFGKTYPELAVIFYRYRSIHKYTHFTIPKKNQGVRNIYAPTRQVKEIQTKLKNVLYEIYPGKAAAHGFALNKSIVTNAKMHLDKKFIFNVDLEDYFGTIHFGRVRNLFMNRPFEFNRDVATILAQICCHQNALPQGAPTSPILANMVSYKFDSQLQSLAKKTNSTYTRYADDITFSFTNSLTQLPKEIVTFDQTTEVCGLQLTKIINDNGFQINTSKVRLSSKYNRMEVTGLTVNEFPNVRRNYIRQIGSMLYAWDKHGYDNAESEFNTKYDSSLRASGVAKSFVWVLKGKLAFLQSVRGSEDPIFKKLAEKFNSLTSDTNLHFRIIEPTVEPSIDEQVKSALWVIETGELDETDFVTQGTGFDLENFGIVTCAHVVSNENIALTNLIAFKVGSPSNRYVVRVLYLDNDRDIAICELISADSIDVPFNPLSLSSQPPRTRESVQLLGFPSYGAGTTEPNHVDAQITNTRNISFQKHFIIDKQIGSGNSGGPIVNQDGKLLGIAKKGARQSDSDSPISTENLAVNASEITESKTDRYKVELN